VQLPTLHLQDHNLTVEWTPGNFCAFDGKLFTQEVLDWEGEECACFIYFAKKIIFECFDLPLPLSQPQIDMLNIPDTA
jgi:hypothetical protein